MLRATFPDHVWEGWLFDRIPRGFWNYVSTLPTDSKSNPVKAFFTHLETQLKQRLALVSPIGPKIGPPADVTALNFESCLFVYGSLRSESVRRVLFGGGDVGSAVDDVWLVGHTIATIQGKSYPALVVTQNSHTKAIGTLLCDVTSSQFEILDQFEVSLRGQAPWWDPKLSHVCCVGHRVQTS